MHWGVIAVMDFYTVKAWTKSGLARFHVLFMIDRATRRVEIVGVSDQPYGQWHLMLCGSKLMASTES